MSELKKLSMSELIAKFNELAVEANVEAVTEFKNLAAARDAVAKLQMKIAGSIMGNGVVVEGAEATATPKAAGDQKYSTVGKRGPNQGVGAFAKELLAAGQDNKTVLAAVKEKFPDAKTTTACIAFYRAKLKVGPVVVSPEELRAKAQALLDQATAAEAAAVAAAEAAAAKAAEVPVVPETAMV